MGVAGSALAFLALGPTAAWAQIATDGSLGPQVTLTPDAANNITIPDTLGREVGSNLFHSLLQLNVNTGQTATFTGQAHINNVLTRVTGGSTSHIDGLLRTSGMPNANFFLINPAGVIFGPGAQLDVGGAFIVTTANEVRLADGGKFAVTTDPAESVLTSAAPTAFGFLTNNPGGVTVEGKFEQVAPNDTEFRDERVHLAVKEGRTLSVVAGNVRIINGKLEAPSGRVNIVSGKSAGEVQLEPIERDAPLPTDTFTAHGDVELSPFSEIRVDGEGGGRVVVRADDLTLKYLSMITTANLGSISGGGIDIDLTGKLSLVGASSISSYTPGPADGGDLRITADSINIAASDDVFLSFAYESTRTDSYLWNEGHTSFIASAAGGPGKGGDVFVSAPIMTLSNGGNVSSFSMAIGDGGELHITADLLELSGNGNISSYSEGTGGGGNLWVAAIKLNLTNSGQLNSIAKGMGLGGQIRAAGDQLEFSSGQITSSTLTGEGGDMDLQFREILGTEAGILSVNLGNSQGGSIRMAGEMSETITLTNSTIGSLAKDPTNGAASTGTGGDVDLRANQIELRAGTKLFATNEGALNQAGRVQVAAASVFLSGQDTLVTTSGVASSVPEGIGIHISATEILRLEDSAGISSQAAAGESSGIRVTTDTLELAGDGWVALATHGSGAAGPFEIHANSISLSGGGLSVDVYDTGSAGAISLNPASLSIDDGGWITVTTHGNGSAGGITIDTPVLDIGWGGRISSIALTDPDDYVGEGPAGNIVIDADSITMTGGAISAFTASTAQGGDVILSTTSLDILGGEITVGSEFGYVESLGSSGKINISTETATLSGSTTVIASINGSDDRGGDISLIAMELDLRQEAHIGSYSFGYGRGGDIHLTAMGVNVREQAQIGSFTFGDGRGGDIYLTEISSLAIATGGTVRANTYGWGDGGDITVHASDLKITGGATIAVGTADYGDGGTAHIDATRVYLHGEGATQTTGIHATTIAPITWAGAAGDVVIHTDELQVWSGASIGSNTAGFGDGGTVDITANRILLNGIDSDKFTGISAQTLMPDELDEPVSESDEGVVPLVPTNFEELLTDGFEESHLADSCGIIQLVSYYEFETIETVAILNPAGTGGNIFVNTSDLWIYNGAAISVATMGSGLGGLADIAVTSDLRLVHGGMIHADAYGSGSGDLVTVTAPNIRIDSVGDSALEILPGSDSLGPEFAIIEFFIPDFPERVQVDSEVGAVYTAISAQTHRLSNGGGAADLILDVGDLEILRGGQLSSTTFGAGKGGDIDVTADTIVIASDGTEAVTGIGSQTHKLIGGGDGGDISIIVGRLEITGGGISAATRGEGDSGSILIDAGDILIDGLGQGASIGTNTNDIQWINENSSEMDIDGTVVFSIDRDSELDGFTPIRIAPFDGYDRFPGIIYIIDDFNPAPFISPILIDEVVRRIETSQAGRMYELQSLLRSTLRDRADNLSVSFFPLDRVETTLSLPTDLGPLLVEEFQPTYTPPPLPDPDDPRPLHFGQGGDLTIYAWGDIELRNGAALSSASYSDGTGGTLTIEAQNLFLNNSRLESRSAFSGGSGNICVTIYDRVVLRNGSVVAANARRGDAGNVSVTAGTAIDLYDSQITGSAGRDGANIKLTAPNRITARNSTITGHAGRNGGVIDLDPQLVLLENSFLDGRAGGEPVQVLVDPRAAYLNINSQILTGAPSLPPELDLSGSLVNMPALQFDTNVDLIPSCAVRFATDESSFTVYSPRSHRPMVHDWVPTIDLALPPETPEASPPPEALEISQ